MSYPILQVLNHIGKLDWSKIVCSSHWQTLSSIKTLLYDETDASAIFKLEARRQGFNTSTLLELIHQDPYFGIGEQWMLSCEKITEQLISEYKKVKVDFLFDEVLINVLPKQMGSLLHYKNNVTIILDQCTEKKIIYYLLKLLTSINEKIKTIESLDQIKNQIESIKQTLDSKSTPKDNSLAAENTFSTKLKKIDAATLIRTQQSYQDYCLNKVKHQLIFEKITPPTNEDEKLINHIQQLLEQLEVNFLELYAKGLNTNTIVEQTIQLEYIKWQLRIFKNNDKELAYFTQSYINTIASRSTINAIKKIHMQFDGIMRLTNVTTQWKHRTRNNFIILLLNYEVVRLEGYIEPSGILNKDELMSTYTIPNHPVRRFIINNYLAKVFIQQYENLESLDELLNNQQLFFKTRIMDFYSNITRNPLFTENNMYFETALTIAKQAHQLCDLPVMKYRLLNHSTSTTATNPLLTDSIKRFGK